jgi:hypothetical protein
MSEPFHWHNCPHCYDDYTCAWDCTIEPDLAEPGRPFGSSFICNSIHCHIRAAIDRYEERREERLWKAKRLLTCVESS